MSPPTRVLAAGIDTWSICWYVEHESPAADALRALATQPSARGSFFVPEKLAGHRVGWFPGALLAVAEGHPAPEGSLAPLSALPAAQRGVERAMADVGIPLATRRAKRGPQGAMNSGRGGVRRLDLTVDVAFQDRNVGLAALEAIAHLDVARAKSNTWRDSGRIETVNQTGYGGRRIMGRIYDKGIEAGSARPGQLIRLEDQRRFQAGRRPDAERLTPATVHQLFRSRFGGIEAAPSITAADFDGLSEALGRLVDDGTLRPSTAEKLAGCLMMQTASPGLPPRSNESARRTYFRRRRQLRELGLVLLRDSKRKPIEISLGDLFSVALGESVWRELIRESERAA